MNSTDKLLETLKARHGQIALVSDSTGWHVMYMHIEPSGSVNEPNKVEWRPLTGINVSLVKVLSMADKGLPTVK